MRKEKISEQMDRMMPWGEWETAIKSRYYMGVQEYYEWATCVNLNFKKINRRMMTVLTNRCKRKEDDNAEKREEP